MSNILSGIAMVFILIIAVPLFIVFTPFMIVGHLVYTYFEKRRYATSGCSAPYEPYITKSPLFRVFEHLKARGLSHEIWNDDDFEYIYCPEKAICFLIVDCEGIYEEDGKFAIAYPPGEATDHDLVSDIHDLEHILTDIEAEKDCIGYIVLDAKRCETVDVSEETLSRRFIEIHDTEKLDNVLR